MKILLIYYNPNRDCFYTRIVFQVANPMYEVGYVNQFGHQVVQIFYFKNNRLINCISFYDYVRKSNELDEPIRNKLINVFIHLLNKFKKE